MLQVIDLNFGYGEVPLYQGVNFIVGKGQKVGLVGQNGSGKSTLLKILTGKEEGYTGRVGVMGKIASVPQEVKYDEVLDGSKSALEYIDPNNEYGEHELGKLLKGLELEINLDNKPSEFSGGQKTKLALARALLAKPDVLLLDEPTNFMDTAGKKFVMNFLSTYQGTVVVISHDLKLMDSAIDKILFVSPATKSIEEYKGNYSAYLKLKAEKDALQKRQAIMGQKQVKKMEEAVARAMGFKSEKGVRARVQLQKRLERMKESLPQLPPEVKKIKIRLPEVASVGEIPIKTVNISKSYGDLQVLRDVNFTIIRKQKIALIGPNGAGKSTFIKIMMDRLQPDSGEVVRNYQLKVGYYSQEFETFDFNQTLLDAFMHETRKDQAFSRAFLGRFNFIGDKVFQKIETLSGGEKTRLSIAILMGVDNNLLILDEPTTYLDVLSQRIILESLKQYEGTMIIVSHESEFLKELKPDKAYLFPEEKMVFWEDELLQKAEEV